MSEREHAQVPEGSVVITPQQQFDMLLAIRDEMKHLSSVVDPSLAQLREGQASNAARIELIVAERKAEDEKLGERVHTLETAGFVTATRMWTVVGVLAAAIVAIITAITYLQQA